MREGQGLAQCSGCIHTLLLSTPQTQYVSPKCGRRVEELALPAKVQGRRHMSDLACYYCAGFFSLLELLPRLADAMVGVWFVPSDTRVEGQSPQRT